MVLLGSRLEIIMGNLISEFIWVKSKAKYWLRFVARFQRKSDKINFEEIIVKADNKLINIEFDDYEEKFEETLNDGYIIENVDLYVSKELLENIYEVAKSQNVKIRFKGRHKYLDYEVSVV